ncbi:MAG: carboxylesterase/lipase family protein [Candidatus Margulisiibacteriota bacterium]
MMKFIRKNLIWLVLIIILLAAAAKIFFLPQRDIVQLDSGPISGKTEDGIRTFLGIPFAAPPVGELRWQPPQPAKPWKKVRACTKMGPACPQPNYLAVGPTDEDCLYLNVWIPAKGPDKKLPVMVFIHGGAFTVGSAAEKDYNGANLAKKGVVVVTLNYRLGPFGFLSHPLLSQESPYGASGNYGLMDQNAALKWVNRNISSFGGDPNNVTIFGESAGSVSVAMQLIMPMSKGLFQRAIAESGGPYGLAYLFPQADGSMAKALKMGESFSQALKADTLKEMRSKTSEEILAAFDFSLTPISKGMKFGPVVDNYVIPDEPKKLYQQGKQAKVKVIIGSNADEGNIFYKPLSLKQYQWLVKSIFKANSDKVLTMFPASTDKDVRSAYNKLITAAMFSEPARFVVRSQRKKGIKAYLYKFTRVPNTKKGKELGAFHSVELPYVFGHLNKADGYTEDDLKLSRAIMGYWTNFAKTGDPNGAGLPLWPIYNAGTDKNLEFGNRIKVDRHLLKDECDLIDSLVL